MTMQPEIYHQISQSFYPSEPFKKNHITMRHPVGLAAAAAVALVLKVVSSYLALLTKGTQLASTVP